jgi:Flp pilus assembly protein TadD
MHNRESAGLRGSAAVLICAAVLLTGCATANPQGEAAPPAANVAAVQTALAQADRALSKGDFSTARKGYRKVLAMAPGTAAAQLGLGEVELAAGDSRQALDNFNRVAETDPGLRPGALQGQGLALIRLGRPEAAMPILKEAVTLDPGLWRAWNALGSLEDAQHNWAAADDAYGRALALKPDAALVLNNMGMSKLIRRDYAGAEQTFAKALAMDPDLKEAAANLRLAQAWQGRYEEALRGGSEDGAAQRLNDVGYVAMLRGDLAIAEALFLRAISASPTYHEVAHKNLEEVERLRSSGAVTPAAFQ